MKTKISNTPDNVLTLERFNAMREALKPKGPQLYGIRVSPCDLQKLREIFVFTQRGDWLFFTNVAVLEDPRLTGDDPVVYYSREEFEKAAQDLQSFANNKLENSVCKS